MPSWEVLIQLMQRRPRNWLCRNTLMTVCLHQAMTSGTNVSTQVPLLSTLRTTLTTDNTLTSSSSQSNQFCWSLEESMTHMKWMRSREQGCLITPTSPRIETSTVSWAGSLTSMSSAQRIITLDMWVTESTLMGQWITMWLSITQLWQTLNSLDKMLHPSL